MFQEDNDRKLTSKICCEYLEQMKWKEETMILTVNSAVKYMPIDK